MENDEYLFCCTKSIKSQKYSLSFCKIPASNCNFEEIHFSQNFPHKVLLKDGIYSSKNSKNTMFRNNWLKVILWDFFTDFFQD